MTDWLMTAQMGVVALVILFGPGLATAFAVGLRGLIAWGSAPMMSGAVVAVAAIVAPLLGLNWSIWVLAGATAVFAAICYGMWRLSGRWRSPAVRSSRRTRRNVFLAVGASVLVSAGFEARRLFNSIGSPNAVAQSYDTSYHLNSVMLILQTGDASSLNMTLTTTSQNAFYPAVWHDVTALVAQLTGGNVPAAANWVTVALACVVWPLSLLALGRVLFGPRPLLLSILGVLAFAFPQFPNHLVGFGILYPNIVSVAYLPAVLASIVLLFWRSRGRGRWAPLTVAGAGCLALLFAQPNGLFAVGYLMVPILALLAWDITRKIYRSYGYTWRLAIPWVSGIVVCVFAYWAAGLIPMVAQFRTEVNWPARATAGEAIENVISLSANLPSGAPNVAMAVAVGIGFVVALVVRRWRWVALGYLVLGWLYVVSVSADARTRQLITGYWYGDSQRLAAQLPVLAVPLATLGAYTVVHMVSDFLLRRHLSLAYFRRLAGVPALTAVLGLLVIVVLPRTEVYKSSFAQIQSFYNQTPAPDGSGRSALVDADSLEMMDQVRAIVPAGQIVADNPWEGSTAIWPLADREPLFPFQKMELTSDQEIIANELNQANWNPEVCPALKREDVHYVIRSSTSSWAPEDTGYRGLNGIVNAGVAKLVASDGDTRLYEITACGDY